MQLHLDYIKDKNGKTKSVVIPQSEWNSFFAGHLKTEKKLQVLTGISKALDEVKQMREGKKPKRSLRSLLNEI